MLKKAGVIWSGSPTVSRGALRWPLLMLGIAAVALLFAPLAGSRSLLDDLFFILTLLTLAQWWNLLAGYAGLVSVGQQAFVGLGAYSLFGCVILGGIDPLLAVGLAGLVAALLALPTAFVVFRLRGAYFAIGTWVVAEVYRLLFAQVKELGGGTGTSLPTEALKSMAGVETVKSLLGLRSSEAREVLIYWAAAVLAIGTLVAIYWFLRSRQGFALSAIRDSERAAESIGIDTFRAQLGVYVISAFGAGLTGSLIFLQRSRISPDAAFSVQDWTAYVLVIVIIGGVGTIEGPIVGVLIFYLMQTYLADYGVWYLMLLGALAIAVMLIAPKGVWGYFAERTGVSLFSTRRTVRLAETGD